MLARSRWYFERADIIIEDDAYAVNVLALIKERCKTLNDVVEQSHFFFKAIQQYDETSMRKHIKANSAEIVTALINRFDEVEEWQADVLHEIVKATVAEFEVGFAKVAQPVRIAVTGSTNSPSIDQTLALLGKRESMVRLRAAADEFAQYAK